MSSIKTNAIVLRNANYGETNRMLTLLSPDLGLLSASARGCRKATSHTLSATELFTSGEYVFFQKDDRLTLTSFQLHENFYPLRADFDRLAHGVYWLNVCEAVSQPNESGTRLFKMLLLSLAVLTYGSCPPRALTAVFLMQLSYLQGFMPRLDMCIHCGRPLQPPIGFDVESGGACCLSCCPQKEIISPLTLLWLQEAQVAGAFVLAGRRELPQAADPGAAEEPFGIMRKHVEYRLEKQIKSGQFL